MSFGLRDLVSRIGERLDRLRLERRWRVLRARGMHIGQNVWLPGSTFIDTSSCFLISIGDHCGFGEECMILAHDAQMDEFLDAGRLGRVVIHPSCHIGARCVILAGVEVGPRTIVGAGSVIASSLPPDTVCAGSPAKVICSREDYLAKHRTRLAGAPTFPYKPEYTPAERATIARAAAAGDVYVTGGNSAELRGEGGTPRTPLTAPRADAGGTAARRPALAGRNTNGEGAP